MNAEVQSSPDIYRILSLDGGGAKGFYTLGVLKEVEALIHRRLWERFDLIFGTSTGAIIAALLALGRSVDDIHKLYKEHVPAITGCHTRRGRTKALVKLARTVLDDSSFTDVNTGLGIVATNWALEKPMIFKAYVAQAHGRHGTFEPGFGCTVADAVIASCSAYPFFERPILKTSKGDAVELIDGGYCANNPTLYAIADAVMALKKKFSDLRVVSVGVGTYPEPKRWGAAWLIKRFVSVQLLQKTLDINTESMEQLREILFKEMRTIRISDTFESPEMATDLLESNQRKLDMLYQRGGESFARYEQELKEMLL